MYKIDHKNLRAKIKNLFLKTMICFSGCLMSSASLQKLFCEVCSALKCSFEEFVREKVVFPSYSSAIFPSPPRMNIILNDVHCIAQCTLSKKPQEKLLLSLCMLNKYPSSEQCVCFFCINSSTSVTF